MALKFGLFKTPKHRVFSYKPLHYDEQSERKQELNRMVKEAQTGEFDKENSSIRIKNGLRGTLPGMDGLKRKEALDRRVRLIIVVATLCLATYMILILG